MAAKRARYKYDVFVSYRHRDKEWVRSWLVPKLKEAGVRVCVDYESFEPGAALVTEMERAVVQSRKTVVVLTPEYLESAWAEFENTMVQTLDIAARKRRLVPVLLKPCELPPRMAGLASIDFTSPDERPAAFDRLAKALGRPMQIKAQLRKAVKRYRSHIVDKHCYLDLKGMGISDRVPLRLPLLEMYVPLKARIELPEAETWGRALQVAGRKLSDEEAEAVSGRLGGEAALLDLVRQNDGLIILGDPGAGKTTFLKYLAVAFASGVGEPIGLGPRLPILAPVSAYANALTEKDVPLDRFLCDYYRNRGVDVPLQTMLADALEEGRALLLLDGLDEVKETGARRVVVDRITDFFSMRRGEGNKFVLTSRIIGYRDVRPTVEGLAECTLVDFDEEDIEAFVAKWTGALERAARGDTPVAAQEAANEQEELLTAIHRNPGVRRLAANPLLLTILALMKRQGMTLPERRVELYQKYVETLLKQWNVARGLDRPPRRDLDVIETVRVLAPLALWMHETSPGLGLVKREEALRQLEQIYAARGIENPDRAVRQLLDDVRDYAGLLLERGPGEYGFIHLTFQEYLAAVAIAQKGQREVDPVVAHLSDHLGDETWHEVSLLTIGYLGFVQQRDEAAGAVLEKLIARAPGESGQAVELAGEAVVDVSSGGVARESRIFVVDRLKETMRDQADVKPVRRASAGRILGKLGDPRPEVSTIKGMQLCYVPPGPFHMGDEDEEHLNETLAKPYWIGRYPVTNAQFQAFVGAGGYREARYWPEAERHGFWRDGAFQVTPESIEREIRRSLPSFYVDESPWTGPRDFGEPYDLPNHPVVGVTWYECLAFGRWLTDDLREKGMVPEGWEMRLPSEAEWEKAARGGVRTLKEPLVLTLAELAQSGTGGPGRLEQQPNPEPRRRYPWGESGGDDESDVNRANYHNTRIGATSAVGCFPGGASPCGCEDLSGNVWEWTRSLSESYPYDGTDGREKADARASDRRVLRGGSFIDNRGYVRCASRHWDYPIARGSLIGFRLCSSPF